MKLRLRRGHAALLVIAALIVAAAVATGSYSSRSWNLEIGPVPVRPSLENRLEDGSLYTPTTLSLLRGHSWLEGTDTLRGRGAPGGASFELTKEGDDKYLKIENFPLSFVVPRLHYTPARPPDRFDAFNLMMAEFSRNGLSVPRGDPEDEIAHYETNLGELVPWTLKGDYQFVPNPEYRPQRVALVNNCLAAGLWEISAADRSGEIYHAWFDFPADRYMELVARTNGLNRDFVEEALVWKDENIPLALDRLRRVEEDLGTVAVEIFDEEVTYSTQDSRRKISRQFALLERGGFLESATSRREFLESPVAMSSFVPPGLYSNEAEERTRFDFTFLARPEGARLRLVEPLTHYSLGSKAGASGKGREKDGGTLEMEILLGGGTSIVIGNLPLALLVEEEDYALHGFGVGILAAGGLAERRQLLLELAPPPSFAYLVEEEGGVRRTLNSHGKGLEQIFLRSRPNASPPHWEVTVTSYERIVDLVRYHVEMPERLVPLQRRQSAQYIPPVYFNYRDDNVN